MTLTCFPARTRGSGGAGRRRGTGPGEDLPDDRAGAVADLHRRHRAARSNIISHLLDQIPHKKLKREKVKIPARSTKGAYNDQASLKGRRFVPEKY
jgi:hypothetical protein